MREFLVYRFILTSLLLAYAISWVLPSYANEDSDHAVLEAEFREYSCIAPAEKDPGNIRQTTSSAQCDPLPIALDVRFMDDDYSSLSYVLPVALDLDWESGEP
ncbi:MAG: hypothetical protein OEM63_03350 [Gammaproteobacteria bacterium]|nr:hypothetical protein [Gammaproteobacteria bacterium]